MKTEIEIKKEFGLIQWETRMSVGYGIGNAFAIALLPLPGAKSPVDGTTALTVATNGVLPADVANYYKGLSL